MQLRRFQELTAHGSRTHGRGGGLGLAMGAAELQSCNAAYVYVCMYGWMDVRERVNWPVDAGPQQVDEQLLHSLHFWERGEPPSHCSLECLECLECLTE
jgi:hypothetical protein